MRINSAIATLLLVGSAHFSMADTSRNNGSADHSGHTGAVSSHSAGLTEPGQSAFAALSEVVTLLEADPATDWSMVDLGGLRAHLVDMDRLVTGSVVTETPLPQGLSVLATGDAETVAALKRMVPAHARQLARDGRWHVVVEAHAQGVQLTVTSEDAAVVARIKGLGFFGLMASQDHHREHHLMMARGQNAHQH